MLKTFRKNRKSLFGFVAIGFVGLIMVPFGLNMYSERGSQGAVIRIGETEIDSNEYYNTLSRLQELYRRQLGPNYAQFRNMLNLEQRAIDELINRVLFERLIDMFGLSASVRQIEEKIASHPFFNGEVSQSSLDTFVRSLGMTKAQLEIDTKRDIVAEQLQTLLSDVSIPTVAELKEIYLDENRKASFRFVAFTPQDFEEKVDTKDEEVLKTYFTEHAEEYRTARAVQYTFVKYQPGDFLKDVELTEEDLLDAYEQRRHLFFEPKQVHLRKIVLNKPAEDPKQEKSPLEQAVTGESPEESALQSTPSKVDQKREQAEKLVEQLNAGVPFAELATNHSEDPAAAKNGGDLGWMKYADLEDALRDPAAKLEKEEHSELIETDSAFYIIYVEDKKERRQKELEEVRPQLEEELRRSDAPVYAQAAAEAFFQKWREKSAGSPISLKEFAESEGRSAQSTEKPLASGESAAGVPSTLTEEVNGFAQGEREVLEVGDSSYIVEIEEVKESRIPEFEETRAKVVDAYKKERAKVLAKEAADQALAQMMGKHTPTNDTQEGTSEEKQEESVLPGKTLEQVASDYSLKVETTQAGTRASATGPVFASPQARRTAFTLTEEKPLAPEVFEVGASYYLLELADSSAPEDKEFGDKRAELKSRESKQAGARLMDMLMKSLRAEADVWVEPKLLESQSASL